MNEQKTIRHQNIVLDTGIYCQLKDVALSCSFKTIPNDLRQHPLSVAIIHSASIGAFRGKPPAPSINPP